MYIDLRLVLRPGHAPPGPAALGDVDGDNVGDLAVGAIGDDDGGNATGTVWILFLNTHGNVKVHQKISATEGTFTGELGTEDAFEVSVGALGDLDDDGVEDLAVGAPGEDVGAPAQAGGCPGNPIATLSFSNAKPSRD